MNSNSLLSPKRQEQYDLLDKALSESFSEARIDIVASMGEITITLSADAASQYTDLATWLRDDTRFGFKTLIDICGIDYSAYAQTDHGEVWPKRFAVITHLLSLEHNWRLRLRVFVPDDDFPVVDSLTPLWPAASWFEREAFDLYGIAFNHHEDLRRILTDYGFIGHPFRKDFPISGYVEMRFDPEQHRVVYQPVSIERRDIKPRAVRQSGFAGIQDAMDPEPPAPKNTP